MVADLCRGVKRVQQTHSIWRTNQHCSDGARDLSERSSAAIADTIGIHNIDFIWFDFNSLDPTNSSSNMDRNEDNDVDDQQQEFEGEEVQEYEEEDGIDMDMDDMPVTQEDAWAVIR